MRYIKKIKLLNFKRFQNFSVPFDQKLNVFIGDNESGKSTILEAINITLSGRRKFIDIFSLESLFNYNTIKAFLDSERKYEDLPELFIELYLDDSEDADLNGQNNSEGVVCNGIRFECRRNDDLGVQIKEILSQENKIFPFEYYNINYSTFSGEVYTGYKKIFKHISIDHSQIGGEYALREYIKGMYNNLIEGNEKPRHFNEYRKAKNKYTQEVLSDLNSRIEGYKFSIRNNSRSNLETDLTILDNEIDIENKGKGRQSLIKTEFALSKGGSNVDIILIEEPENHLSHINLNKMIKNIIDSRDTQLFISTHSNMISSRLDLRKAILLNSSNQSVVILNTLEESTAKFFIKAPHHNILDYILSKKVILVEGDAEYILMEQFFRNITESELSAHDVHIISVGGTSFKRYLELGRLLNIKTAVIRDNDGNYQENFSDNDNNNHTFEICIYNCNKSLCDGFFGPERRTLSVLDYMLNNKAEAAYQLLDKKGKELMVPEYIREAILWVKT
jgi:putative ATP-dependent endonuclease of OLD family